MSDTLTHEEVVDLLVGPRMLLQSRAVDLARTALALYEITGRDVPPTDAEIDAHAAAGGRWWVIAEWGRNDVNRFRTGSWVQSWAPQIARLLREQENTRWWAHDATGAPCAWPKALPAKVCECGAAHADVGVEPCDKSCDCICQGEVR